MGRKEEYIEKLNSQLKVLGDRIDGFTERVEHEALEHKIRLQREIAEFNARRLDVQIKLRQLKESTGDAWEALAAGMDKAWSDLKEAGRQIAEKFKQPR
ncbi:MAG: hypothetical protein PHV36_02425 [Elusimicrobiales bacterium]|nr:hypothetical protein [Elusimicrobiales bacterium]